MVKMCSFRGYGATARDGYCHLYLDELEGDKDRDRIFPRSYERFVFSNDGRTSDIDRDSDYPPKRCWCDDAMSAACPFRAHVARPKRIPSNLPPLVECPYCKRKHRQGGGAMAYCENWYKAQKIFEQMANYNESWDPKGTREDPFKGMLEPTYQQWLWDRIRSAVMRRDKYTCTECGAKADHGELIDDTFQISTHVYDASTMTWKYYRLKPDDYGYHAVKTWNPLEVHHIIFRENGGSHHPRNLRTMCSRCHHHLHSIRGGGGRNMEKRKQMNRKLEDYYGRG
jgi:5-methylcytosine-specific restriction endonuclease McrA